MSHVQIYDRPMCCATGVCGPEIDPVLPRFAGDLEWLTRQGHIVERFNLAQQPGEFVTNSEVQRLLQNEGNGCLPLVFVDGQLVSRGDYPSRQNLALWTETASEKTANVESERLSSELSLPVLGGECSGSQGCC